DAGHTYTDEGSYALRTTIIADNQAVSLNANIAVADHDQLAQGQAVTITTTPNTSFTGIVGSFTDTDLVSGAADFVATIDWGDGSLPTVGTVTGSQGVFSVTGSHSYSAGGEYSVEVTLTDADGSATASTVSTALVVSPTGVDLVDPGVAA